MPIDNELIALLTGVVGALLALLYKWLEGKFVNMPSFSEVVDIALSIVTAARENHDLPDNPARLQWAMEKLQKYLDAKGISRYFDARALVEYALELLKDRAPGFGFDRE